MDSETKCDALYYFASMLLQDREGLTFKEISQKWENCSLNLDHNPLDDSTYRRYREKIKQYLGYDIKYVGRVYKIVSNNSSIRNDIKDWGISVQAIGSRLKNCETLADRILLEKLPSSDFLDIVIACMRNNQIIVITYQEYGHKIEEEIKIQPYCLKTYHHRWYVLGKLDTGKFKIYCMDRFNDVRVLKQTFVMDPNFNAEDFFSEFYAVRLDKDRKPQKVILRAHEDERFILDRQPIHTSQKKRSEGDNYWDFEYYLRPTFDFVSYLESQGRFLEVIEPLWLRRELNRVHVAALEQNKTDDLCLKYNPHALSATAGGQQ